MKSSLNADFNPRLTGTAESPFIQRSLGSSRTDEVCEDSGAPLQTASIEKSSNRRSLLKWEEESRRDVFQCRVFSIHESVCRSPDNTDTGVFVAIDSADWAIILPVMETEQGKAFVMVRQWRHGAQEMSLEFPGGVFESGETPTSAALRELEEETAYTARKITSLGMMSPNPAIMSNHTYFFLAEELEKLPAQRLDKDEYVDVEIVPINEALNNMGKPPYIHALMGTAVALYMQKAREERP